MRNSGRRSVAVCLVRGGRQTGEGCIWRVQRGWGRSFFMQFQVLDGRDASAIGLHEKHACLYSTGIDEIIREARGSRYATATEAGREMIREWHDAVSSRHLDTMFFFFFFFRFQFFFFVSFECFVASIFVRVFLIFSSIHHPSLRRFASFVSHCRRG